MVELHVMFVGIRTVEAVISSTTCPLASNNRLRTASSGAPGSICSSCTFSGAASLALMDCCARVMSRTLGVSCSGFYDYHSRPPCARQVADDALTDRDAIAGTISSLPAHLRRSLTWDQGAEMAQHTQLRIDTGLEIYFCDPQSPWQRGSNENTNGLPRQYFPKGTGLSQHGTEELSAVAHALNTRPRKTLGWQTPAEALDRLLKQDMNEGVATTG